MYAFASSNLRASYYYSTLMKQRALSKGEFEYYENKVKLSEEMGGLFTPQPSERLLISLAAIRINKPLAMWGLI